MLYDLYWNKKMSGKDIGNYFHYDKKHSIIQGPFRYLNIPMRSKKEEYIKNAYESGKFIQKPEFKDFKAQNHISWNNKKFYLRSSYEKDFAEELDKQKIDYQVEGLRIKYFDSIKNEYRTAIPDFYIKEQNLIIEIKSPWTLNFQNMVDKENEYRKQGYNFRIIFEHEEYNSVKDINFSECRLKQNLDTTRFEKVRMYKQKDGFRWITKNGKTSRCNKNDVEEFIKNGWRIGRK